MTKLDRVAEKNDEAQSEFVVVNVLILTLAFFLTIWRTIAPSLIKSFVAGPTIGNTPIDEFVERVLYIVTLAFISLSALYIKRIKKLMSFFAYANTTWISIVTTLVLTLSLGTITYWESFRGELWFGYGLGFAMLCLAIAGLVVCFGRSRVVFLPDERLTRATSVFSGILALAIYLPSIIQPPRGIIDLSHSRYILNETIAQVAGVTPLGNFVPQYTSLLGWPLVLFGWIPNTSLIAVTVYWLNFLTLVEIIIIWRTATHCWNRVPSGVTLLIVFAFLFIKVQPSDSVYGSVAASMVFLPGRTLMPMALGLYAIRLSKPSSKWFLKFLIAGALATLTAINNPDFGIPACVAFLVVLIVLLGKRYGHFKSILAQLCGGGAALAMMFLVYYFRGIPPRFSYVLAVPRAFASSNDGSIPMPAFGLHILFIAIFAIGVFVGFACSFSGNESHLRVSMIYGSTWGILSFPYYINRSVNSNLQFFLFHSVFVIFGLSGYIAPRILASSGKKLLACLPVLLLVAIPVVSLSQMPDPRFEMKRLLGNGPTFSEWTADSISEGAVTYGPRNSVRTGSVAELLEVAARFPDEKIGFFGENGNAIQLLTGITNVLGVNGRQDLLMPGIVKLACQRIRSERPNVVLVPRDPNGSVFPLCPELVNVGFTDSVGIFRVRLVASGTTIE